MERTDTQLRAEHMAGEHSEDLIVDCSLCRADAAELGMDELLPPLSPIARRVTTAKVRGLRYIVAGSALALLVGACSGAPTPTCAPDRVPRQAVDGAWLCLPTFHDAGERIPDTAAATCPA